MDLVLNLKILNKIKNLTEVEYLKQHKTRNQKSENERKIFFINWRLRYLTKIFSMRDIISYEKKLYCNWIRDYLKTNGKPGMKTEKR